MLWGKANESSFVASSIPSWQAECLKTHQRGTLLLVSFGTCITFGVMVSYWIVYGLSFAQPSSVAWRFPISFAMFFTLPALLIVCFMPESPRWLLLKGREKEAVSVLSALNEVPEDSEDVRREVLQIKYAVKHMASAPASNVFSNGQYRYLHRTLLAILLQVMQQWTGVNLFIQYLGSMFRNQLLYSEETSMLLAACCSTEFFVASLAAVVTIDRFWGRRTLTMFGASGMCFCMIMLCIFNYIGSEKHMWAFKVMTLFLFLYNTCMLPLIKLVDSSSLSLTNLVRSFLDRLARHELDVGRRAYPIEHKRSSERNGHCSQLAHELCRRRRDTGPLHGSHL